MDALPDLVLDYLQENVSDLLSPACLCVDNSGGLLGWSGAVEAYSFTELKSGQSIESLIPLVVGLDDVEEAMVFPLIGLAENIVVNIHVLPRKAGGLYVLLLDAMDEHNSQQVYQQKANEVQLLNARLKKVLHQLEKTQAELEQKKAEAEEASRLKSRFIAGMSHEFRTPLTSIMGYTEMLQKGMLDSQQLNVASQSIASGAQHLMSLIDNVLDQARFAVGEMALHNDPVDLVVLMAEIQFMFAPLAEQKGLNLTLHSSLPSPCWVEVDGMRLRQLLINLCNNAIKYTDEGAVSLSSSYADGQFVFAVKDTGPGIAEQEQASIFNAFHRVSDQSTKQGAGLGLAISQQILEMMGGGLTLASRLGEGSEFTLSVPVPSLSEQHRHTDINAGVVKQAEAATVLVAEDNPDVVQLVELFLQSGGYEVLIANTGQSAIDLAVQHNPDLILMDMNMPVLDGYAAVKQLREKGFAQPVLALTASPAPQDKERALASGCNSYLLKPIAMDELLSKVNEYLAMDE